MTNTNYATFYLQFPYWYPSSWLQYPEQQFPQLPSQRHGWPLAMHFNYKRKVLTIFFKKNI